METIHAAVATRLVPPRCRRHRPGRPSPVPSPPPREREILALLEQSMSNKRIALVLNLSVDTVKWNLRQIYAKLNVSRRNDAILVARSAAQRPG
ncbi:helix-turn-helix transcriptional regulator [Cupriavidus sp. BIC8F]|uniref:helix-turn-helix domain-containing protein n=1 Tax=Cupriavidus sp. BIC8F TaxID=3079014 RepID=UPI00291705F5|nr:helix-turn-helix transcriptional regulator [Cupriavidus sp. BIC8F]